jgi:hypothetical protein
LEANADFRTTTAWAAQGTVRSSLDPFGSRGQIRTALIQMATGLAANSPVLALIPSRRVGKVPKTCRVSRIGEAFTEITAEFLVWAALCLIGGAFFILWADHPLLMITGIGVCALVAGWFGYLYRKFMDPQSTAVRRLRAALTASLLAGLCAFAVSLVFCSCT